MGDLQAPIRPVIRSPDMRTHCAICGTSSLDDHSADRQSTAFRESEMLLYCSPADCRINRTSTSDIALPCHSSMYSGVLRKYQDAPGLGGPRSGCGDPNLSISCCHIVIAMNDSSGATLLQKLRGLRSGAPASSKAFFGPWTDIRCCCARVVGCLSERL